MADLLTTTAGEVKEVKSCVPTKYLAASFIFSTSTASLTFQTCLALMASLVLFRFNLYWYIFNLAFCWWASVSYINQLDARSYCTTSKAMSTSHISRMTMSGGKLWLSIFFMCTGMSRNLLIAVSLRSMVVTWPRACTPLSVLLAATQKGSVRKRAGRSEGDLVPLTIIGL